MKCQILFSGKIKKNIISLLSAELAQRMVKVNGEWFHLADFSQGRQLLGLLLSCTPIPF